MKSRVRNPQLLDLLLVKYRDDPAAFRAYLPDVARMLDAMAPPRLSSPSSFGLTEREREYHERGLREVVSRLAQGTINAQEAVRGLEHCANLVKDASLPSEVASDTMVRLLRAALGRSPGSVKRITTFEVQADQQENIVNRVSVFRGALLNLTWDMRLVSVTVNPQKVRERRKLLSFVGSGKDTATDVAEHHDKYLAEQSPHGAR